MTAAYQAYRADRLKEARQIVQDIHATRSLLELAWRVLRKGNQ